MDPLQTMLQQYSDTWQSLETQIAADKRASAKLVEQTAELRRELAVLQDALHDAQHHYAGLVARCQHLDLQSNTVKKLDQAQAHDCAEVERKTYRAQKEIEHNRKVFIKSNNRLQEDIKRKLHSLQR